MVIKKYNWYGYGSIPINTIFSGMNIHLPAILMFTRGTRFWHTAICQLLAPWFTIRLYQSHKFVSIVLVAPKLDQKMEEYYTLSINFINPWNMPMPQKNPQVITNGWYTLPINPWKMVGFHHCLRGHPQGDGIRNAKPPRSRRNGDGKNHGTLWLFNGI